MKDDENIYADYKYDLEELISYVKVLLTAAEQEDNKLTHKDIEHNLEILHEKLHRLYNQFCILKDDIFEL